MRPIFIFLTLLAGTPFNAGADDDPHLYRVAQPVADLRAKPVEASSSLELDPLEESQLLYGDLVQVVEEKKGWANVLALHQSEFSHHNRWEGYPGWIELRNLTPDPGDWTPNLVVSSQWGVIRTEPHPDALVKLTLSIGTRLVGSGQNTFIGEVEVPFRQVKLLDGTIGWIHADQTIPLEDSGAFYPVSEALRQSLVETARLFLGTPYDWGGRAAEAVDCSGLAGLVYQTHGVLLPRDAHEQWMMAKKLSREQLKKGDLIFLSDEKNRRRVTHVMLYIGEDKVIEAPGTGREVREIDLAERLKEAPKRQVQFGTYLESGDRRD